MIKLSAGELYSIDAFFDETAKIASLKQKAIDLAKRTGLLEETHAPALRTLRKIKKDVPGPSKKTKLQLQLMQMKKERGLPL